MRSSFLTISADLFAHREVVSSNTLVFHFSGETELLKRARVDIEEVISVYDTILPILPELGRLKLPVPQIYTSGGSSANSADEPPEVYLFWRLFRRRKSFVVGGGAAR